jgi:hypothetical protein
MDSFLTKISNFNGRHNRGTSLDLAKALAPLPGENGTRQARPPPASGSISVLVSQVVFKWNSVKIDYNEMCEETFRNTFDSRPF